MFENLKKYILDRITLNEAELALIENSFKLKKIKKKQYLLQEGQVGDTLYFVIKGALRLFYDDQKGNEHVIQFAFENWWVGDRESFQTGLPSKYCIEALEDSEVLSITVNDLTELSKSLPAFKEMLFQLQEKNFIKTQERIHMTLSYSAEEKYKYLLSNRPEILSRVPLSMVASYLGMTRETLSRIRSKQLKRN